MHRTFRRLLPILVLSLYLLQSGCVAVSQNRSATATEPGKAPLRVGISANAPPFVFKNGGNVEGLEIDFARQFGAYLDREVKFVELAWSSQIPTLEKGEIDIIMSGMTITKKRSYRVTFSKPYMRTGQMLLVRADQRRLFSSGIYSLMGNEPHIGTIENTTGDKFITSTITRPRLSRFGTSQEAVDALAKGEIDVLVHDGPIVCHWAATYEKTQLAPILQHATEEYLGWAVNRNNPELLAKANDFIVNASNNQALQKTIKRWIPYLVK